MADYILIESRDPFDSTETGNFLDLAEGLSKEGSEVALFLVQNAVMAARHGAKAAALAALAANGVKVLADSFSLQERGISKEDAANALGEVAGNSDERTLVAKAIQKRLRTGRRPADRAGFARLYQYLMRQGFTPSAVSAELRKLRGGGADEDP